MDAIVQHVLDVSQLEVDLIRITEAGKNDYMMEIESRVTKTGPFSGLMSPMTVDLVGPAGAFGKLQLPEIKSTSKGADVKVEAQKIDITDYSAFLAFVKAITQQDKLTLKLENGHGTLKALGMTAKIVYRKEVQLTGMNGPKARIIKAEGSKDDLSVEVQVFNPSPLEIDLGVATYDLVGADGSKIAELSGKQNVTRGASKDVLRGKVVGRAAAGPGKLVGTGAQADTWAVDTNKYLLLSVNVPQQIADM